MLQCRAIELWRPVVGFESVFWVSNCGGVRSGAGPVRPYVDHGYRLVNLAGARHRVHVLVLEAFVCPRPPGLLGLHRDDAKWHNHVSNLYWGTAADNMRDCLRNGTHASASKTHCPRGHELVEPNLVVAQLPSRICKACNRARAWLVFKYGKGWTEGDMRTVSDEYYAGIRVVVPVPQIDPSFL